MRVCDSKRNSIFGLLAMVDRRIYGSKFSRIEVEEGVLKYLERREYIFFRSFVSIYILNQNIATLNIKV